LGQKASNGRLLASGAALKFGFGALFATFWTTFDVTFSKGVTHKRQKLGYFSPVLGQAAT